MTQQNLTMNNDQQVLVKNCVLFDINNAPSNRKYNRDNYILAHERFLKKCSGVFGVKLFLERNFTDVVYRNYVERNFFENNVVGRLTNIQEDFVDGKILGDFLVDVNKIDELCVQNNLPNFFENRESFYFSMCGTGEIGKNPKTVKNLERICGYHLIAKNTRWQSQPFRVP